MRYNLGGILMMGFVSYKLLTKTTDAI